VQYAVDVADPGDIIKVGAGTYAGVNSYGSLSQVVYIDKSLTVRGGYSDSFDEPPDPDACPTILDAEGLGRVIFATGSGVSVTLEGLHLTGGDANGLDPYSAGGGFCAEDVDSALVRNSEIVSNTADVGGGAYYHRSDMSRLDASEVYSNTAREGGGAYFHNTGNPMLTGSYVYSNTSEYNGAGVYVGSGYYDVVLSGNAIHHNVSADGGGGGGVYIMSTNAPWLYNNRIYSNTVPAQGGGLFLSGSRNSEVISNTIRDNEGRTNGGGIYVASSNGCLFEENTISGNWNLGLTGGGIFLSNSDNLTFRNNRIHDNTAEYNNGGGLYVSSCDDLNFVGNGIYGNHAPSGGGIYLYNANEATVAGNQIYSNTASTGGGLHLYIGADNVFMNNVLWANEATAYGSGIRVQNTGAQFMHNTIARNVGIGVAVVQGELWMTNTILVSNTTGVWVHSNCTATLSNTLWGDPIWANTTDWTLNDSTSTLITGTANYREDPVFVDPDAGDYHISPASGAIDRGVYAGVMRDMDDEPRLGVPDLGADEYIVPGTIKYLYLPLILRNAP
jgi:parallel beta-helix repeat protein